MYLGLAVKNLSNIARGDVSRVRQRTHWSAKRCGPVSAQSDVWENRKYRKIGQIRTNPDKRKIIHVDTKDTWDISGTSNDLVSLWSADKSDKSDKSDILETSHTLLFSRQSANFALAGEFVAAIFSSQKKTKKIFPDTYVLPIP